MKEWGADHASTRNICSLSERSDIIDFLITPKYQDKCFLHQKYVVEGLSTAQIAKIVSSSPSTIQKYLTAFGIETRSSQSGLRMKTGYGLAYGKRVIRKTKVDHHGELKMISKMTELRKQGFSYWKIADILNTMKIPTKTRKGKWHARSVQTILCRNLSKYSFS